MGGSLRQQTKWLVYRNFLLKKRMYKLTIQEVLLPVYFIVILALTRMGIRPTTNEAVPYFPPHDLMNTSAFLPDTTLALAASPNSTDVEKVMDQISAMLNMEYIMFEDEESMLAKYANNASLFSVGIIFNSDLSQNHTYAIRTPFEMLPSNLDLYNHNNQGCRQPDGLGTCPAHQYLYTGIAALQTVIDHSLITFSVPNTTLPQIQMQLLPKPEYTTDITQLQIMNSLYLVMAFSPFLGILISSLVYEKEKKIKETMKMMGLNSLAFWFSYSIIYVVLLTACCIICTILSWLFIFPKSNALLLFLMFWLYGLSIVTVSFMMTPFFNKALVAGGVASISSLFMSLLYLPFALTSALPVQLQVVLSFLSPFTMAMAIDKVTKLESVDNGVQFDNIWSAREGELSFAYALIILSVDIVLYLVLAVYFDNVIPGEYGQRKPIFFCFMPSYWKRRETRVDTECTSFLTASVNSIHAEIEPVSAGLQSKVGIRISNLVKVFKSGDKGKDVHAIDGISLDIYEGEITCLLGHNGAGKTTLINALNGMVPPTSGGASIYGLDVTNANDMTHIRSITGICPQQNVILDALTASEHLRVFAGLKGIPPEKIEQEVEKILKDCDLSKCSDKHAKSLSGGQKRKLCVGMALIGDPKILFLDEPSSGMDPYSRRHLWSLLKNNREGRVIVLTTHFMDEADILADRKAIISKGKLRCYGTSLFLKSKFGIGYHLGMYIGEDCDPEKVTAYVQSYIPNAELGRLYGMELTYTLPLHDVGLFAKLFTALDTVNEETGLSVSHSMGINSYGIAMTTLEEVFLKLGDEAESDESMQAAAAPLAEAENEPDYGSLTQKANEDGSYDNKAADEIPKVSRDLSISMTVNGQDSIDAVDFKPAPLQASQVTTRTLKAGRHQFTALMHVRIKLTIRNARTYILRILFPILFMIGGIALVQFINITTDDRTDPAPLVVQPSLYLRAPQEGPSHKTELLYNNDTGNDLTSLSSQFDRLNIEHRLDNLTDLLFQTEKHNLAANIHQWDEINQDVISKYTAMYNDSAVHSIPTILNTMTNVLYGIVSSNDDVFITTYKPFPEDDKALGFNMGMFFALFFGFALITIPNGFAVDIVKDRQFKTKSQLRVSGVRMQKYWLVYLMVGLVQYSIPAITGVILVVIFRVDNFLIPGAMLCMIILLILYLPIATIFQFCTSFMFDKYDTAQSALPWLSYFVPFVFLGPVIALDLLGNYEIAALMSCIFVLLCPVYAIFAGLYYIDRVYEVALVFHGVDNLDVGDYFKFDSYITPTFLCLIFSGFLYTLLLIFLESRSIGAPIIKACRKGNSAPKMTFNPDVFTDEEDDVKSERDKVNELSSISNISDIEAVPVISIKNLRKTFEESKSEGCCQRKKQENEKQSKVAVRNLSLAIHKSEIFGLLGPNGAGKTTTMNMIIADIAPDCGSVYVIGQEIDSPISEAFLLMGYCPQMDPLWEELTTREHLETYAAIKGVHKHDLKQTAHYFLDALKIQEHADKKTKALSGGTKRKLCFAMSMLGEPQVVLMDEPSTGMDPAAKRFLWDTISSSFVGERGAILTTHSMEEADAVCSRVGIMVSGQMKCLGSTQHLKDKYGGGYILEVKLKSSDDEEDVSTLAEKIQKLETFVMDAFPSANMIENFGERIMYKIPRDGVKSLAIVFDTLEEGKPELDIEEYSFSQSTLEQVFLQFAKMQVEEDRPDDEQITITPQ